jgi:hypothetical protein
MSAICSVCKDELYHDGTCPACTIDAQQKALQGLAEALSRTMDALQQVDDAKTGLCGHSGLQIICRAALDAAKPFLEEQ